MENTTNKHSNFYHIGKSEANDLKIKTAYTGNIKCDYKIQKYEELTKFYSFILITSGSGFFTINEEEIAVSETNMIIIKPNQNFSLHSAKNNALTGYIFCLFPLKELNEVIKLANLETRILTNETFTYRSFYNLFDQLIIESQNKDIRYSTQIVNSIAKTIVLKLLHISPIFNLPTNGNSTFKNIKDFIDNHYKENIKLEDVCEQLYTNKFYISRLFKEFVGTTCAHYIIEKRIQTAKILLEDPQKSIESIALEVGYNDFYHFSRLFKKEVGINPKNYRKNLLNDLVKTKIETNINLAKQKIGDIADFGGWNEQMIVKDISAKDGITWIGSRDESKYNQAWFFAKKIKKGSKESILKNYIYSCYIKPLAIDTSSEGKVQLYIGATTHKYCIALYTKNGFVQIWDNITGGWVSEAAKATFIVEKPNLVEIRHRLIEEGKAELTIFVNKNQIIQMEIAEATGDFGMDIFGGTNIYFGNPKIVAC